MGSMASDPRPATSVPRGTILFRPDDPCQGFVVVRQGTIRVSLTAENGREIVLYRVRPGEVCLQTFGCLVKGNAYSAEGVAETDLAIDIVPASEFQRRVEQDLTFRQHLFDAVAARFADLERLVEDVALSSVEERLARALLRLADSDGMLEATHEGIATEIGSAREVVGRQLALFVRAGLIEAARGHIRIVDRPGLEALAHPSG